ncbi:39S ribosomal protein L41, mitochondrial [Microplitis demolitor]|uniref:39S ribosomal protein L41, mitochondrial n=1 Tax=Microplitis demolitor TaxID=69319 RepID=UPI0004CCED5D|nr:39S ribosomal protein L41, mitochondrial [Microplitis demolitor]
MSLPILSFIRRISTSSVLGNKRNPRKFLFYNKAGSRTFKERQRIQPHPLIPINKRGCRDTGITVNGEYVEIPEKIPELIVPDLTNCELKPYVSYRAEIQEQPEMTAQLLFDAIYAEKIKKDFKEGKLDEAGQPLEPSAEESLTAEEAYLRARQTGCDLFLHEAPPPPPRRVENEQ